MATPVVVTGFEFDTVAGLTTGNTGNRIMDPTTIGTPAIATDSAHGGTDYCLELSTTTVENVDWDVNTFGTGKRVMVFSCYIKFVTTLPSVTTRLLKMETATQDCQIRYNPTGTKFEAQAVAGTIISGPSVVADQWYLVQGRMDCSTTTFSLDWSIDKVAQGQALGTGTIADLAFFTLGWNSNSSTTIRYDDFVLSVTSGDYPLGANKIVRLTPDADGTVNQIGTSETMLRYTNNATPDGSFDSSAILTALGDVPPTLGGSSSGLCQNTSGTGNAAEIPMTSYTLAPGEVVNGCRILVCGWANNATAAACNFGVRAYNGSSETTLFTAATFGGQNTATPAWICKMYTGVTSQATLDALTVRLGYSGDVSPLPGAHAVYAEVAILITDTASITASDSGTVADSLSVVSGAIPKTLSESGSVNEQIGNRTFPLNESNTGGDSLSVVVQTVPKTPADAGALVGEALLLTASPLLTESLVGDDVLTVDKGQAGTTCGLYIVAVTPLNEIGQEDEGIPVTGSNQSVTLIDSGLVNDNLDFVVVTVQKTLSDSATACDGT